MPCRCGRSSVYLLPIDRDHVRKQLGFDSIAANSLDVSSDRDFVIEYVFCLSLIATHLGGWAEEWVIWATTEFSFLNLPDQTFAPIQQPVSENF